MVTQTQDAELINHYLATHDPALREEIILRYVPLVHYVLGRTGMSQQMGSDYEDLVSQGLLGLIEAIDRFDPVFGTQFSTYATVKVRSKVLDYLRAMDWLSRTARHRARTVQNAVTSFWETNQRSPTDEELAVSCEMDLEQVQQALVDSSRVMLSLDSIVENDTDGEGSLYELLADDSQQDPSDSIDEKDMKSRLVQALKNLPKREQYMLSLYYFEDLTLKEIGAVLGISESRVCQLHSRAILSLKANLLHSEQPVQPQANKEYQPASKRKSLETPADSKRNSMNKRYAYD